MYTIMSGTKITTPVNFKPQTSCLVNQCFYYTVTALNISIQSVIWVYKSLFHFRLSCFPLFLPSSPPSCDLTSLSGDGEDDAGTPLHSSYVARNAPSIIPIHLKFHASTLSLAKRLHRASSGLYCIYTDYILTIKCYLHVLILVSDCFQTITIKKTVSTGWFSCEVRITGDCF